MIDCCCFCCSCKQLTVFTLDKAQSVAFSRKGWFWHTSHWIKCCYREAYEVCYDAELLEWADRVLLFWLLIFLILASYIYILFSFLEVFSCSSAVSLLCFCLTALCSPYVHALLCLWDDTFARGECFSDTVQSDHIYCCVWVGWHGNKEQEQNQMANYCKSSWHCRKDPLSQSGCVTRCCRGAKELLTEK